MFVAIILAAMAAAPPTAEQGPWELKAQVQGVAVYTRARKGCNLHELKSVGEIDAPPHAVFRMLTDFKSYTKTMPYTEEGKLLGVETKDGKIEAWLFYTVINAPLASRRDYTLRIVDESDWQGGKGYLKTRWDVSNEGPAPKQGVVRVAVNTGSWLLEPLADGVKTRATYSLFIDPGGSLPAWVANKANSSAVPELFAALRKHATDERYARAK